MNDQPIHEQMRAEARAKLNQNVKSIDGMERPLLEENKLNLAFAAVLGGDRGNDILNYLELITIRRALPPDVSSTMLHYMEGARWLTLLLRARIRAGIQLEAQMGSQQPGAPIDVVKQ